MLFYINRRNKKRIAEKEKERTDKNRTTNTTICKFPERKDKL
ncbi:MAG: hypothetical protein L6V93_06770 [Clostridiales bacterium]|nr:MAG: hypothetical protein L6V93_06770 [Clostridiales bacterium]